MKIEFNDYQYLASHSKSPKGFGAWAFSFKRNPDIMVSNKIEGVYWMTQSTYSEARKKMKAIAKEAAKAYGAEYVEVFVLP